MIEWTLPAAKTAYESREEIKKSLAWLIEYLRAQRVEILVTGAAGAGKTVFADRLSGRAYEKNYDAPKMRSTEVENRKVQEEGHRLKLQVVPGQHSPKRAIAVEKALSGRNPVDGVIHVLSHGFLTIRSPVAERALIEEGFTTINQIRAEMLKRETEELRTVVDAVKNANLARRKPRWFMLAVNKYDLLYRKREEVAEYYSPGSTSSPVTMVRDLARDLGTAKFQWLAVPVCSRSEHYRWNDEIVRSSFEDEEREHFIAKFLQGLRELCHA